MSTNFWRRQWRLIVREVRRMVSRPIYLFGVVLAPLVSAFFLITLMWDGLPTDMAIAVVDGDDSSVSRNLIRQLDAFQQTRVAMRCVSFEEARVAMQQGCVYGIYVIPKGFSRGVVRGDQPRVSFYTNNSYLIAGSLLFRDMKMMSVLSSASASRSVRLAKGESELSILGQLQPIVVDSHAIGNPWLNYSVYLNNMLIPGVLQLMVLLMTVYALGSEMRLGSGREWLRLSGGSIGEGLIGKLFPYTLLFTSVGVLCVVILYQYLSFPMNGSLWSMILSIALLVVASQALGVFMIGVLPTPRLGLSFASLFGVLSLSLSGFSFPVFAMDVPLQWAAQLVPLHHYFNVYTDQALNGIAFYYSLSSIVALLLFTLTPCLVLRRLRRAIETNQYKM